MGELLATAAPCPFPPPRTLFPDGQTAPDHVLFNFLCSILSSGQSTMAQWRQAVAAAGRARNDGRVALGGVRHTARRRSRHWQQGGGGGARALPRRPPCAPPPHRRRHDGES